MSGFAVEVWHVVYTTVSLLWMAAWALVLGYAFSSSIQVFVKPAEAAKRLGGGGVRESAWQPGWGSSPRRARSPPSLPPGRCGPRARGWSRRWRSQLGDDHGVELPPRIEGVLSRRIDLPELDLDPRGARSCWIFGSQVALLPGDVGHVDGERAPTLGPGLPFAGDQPSGFVEQSPGRGLVEPRDGLVAVGPRHLAGDRCGGEAPSALEDLLHVLVHLQAMGDGLADPHIAEDRVRRCAAVTVLRWLGPPFEQVVERSSARSWWNRRHSATPGRSRRCGCPRAVGRPGRVRSRPRCRARRVRL